MKTAREIMLESLKTRDDDEDDMDIDPPPIIVTPAEQYRMTPAALKYHQSINIKRICHTSREEATECLGFHLN